MQKKQLNAKKIFSLISITLLIASMMALYNSVYATEIFSDDFEDGTFDAWSTSNTPTISSTGVHHGIYCASLDKADVIYKSFTATSTIYIRAYVQVDTLPVSSDYQQLFETYDQSTYAETRVRISHEDEGNSKWQITGSGGNFKAVATIAADTWYCVEAKIVKSTTVGEYHLWIDGTEVISETGLNTGAENINQVWILPTNAGNSITNIYDCVVISDSYVGTEEVLPTPTPTAPVIPDSNYPTINWDNPEVILHSDTLESLKANESNSENPHFFNTSIRYAMFNFTGSFYDAGQDNAHITFSMNDTAFPIWQYQYANASGYASMSGISYDQNLAVIDNFWVYADAPPVSILVAINTSDVDMWVNGEYCGSITNTIGDYPLDIWYFMQNVDQCEGTLTTQIYPYGTEEEPTPTPTPTTTSTPTTTETPTATSTATLSFILLIIMLILNILLIIFPKVPLLNFTFGIMTIGISALTINDSTLPYQPYFSLLTLLLAALNMLSAVYELRRN